MQFQFKNRVIIFSLILLLISVLLLRFNGINAPFERDEGEYAYGAWLMTHGGVPYQDSFLQKPPMILYTYLLALFIDPNAVWPARVIGLIFELITIILVGLIVQKETKNNVAAIGSMYLVNVMLVFPYLTYFAANTEKFMITPLVGLLCLYVYKKDSCTRIIPLLFGILAAISLLYKPLGAVVITYITFIWCLDIWRKKNSHKFIFQFLVWSVIGGIITVTISLGFFVIHGAMPQLIEQVIIFTKQYAITQTTEPGVVFKHFAVFCYYWIFLLGLIILGAFKFRLIYNHFLAITLLCWLTLLGAKYFHYFFLAVPFTAILASLYLFQISKNMFFANLRTTKYILILLFIFFVICLEINFVLIRFISSDQLSFKIYSIDNNFVDARTVGEHIQMVTTAGDTIYIAGSEPEINFYAKRKNPTKFDISYPFLLNTEFKTKYQKEVMNELVQNPPKLIVLSNIKGSWIDTFDKQDTYLIFLRNFLQHNYTFFEGYKPVWSSSQWTLPILDENLKEYNYLIYRRIY